MDEYKTTQREFKIFKAECQKWIAQFGLTQWEVGFHHQENDQHLAWVTINHKSRFCAFYLNKTWRWKNQSPTDHEVKKTAFHEVCELLLHQIRYLGECRYLSDSEMEPAVHEVIHVLENMIFETKT